MKQILFIVGFFFHLSSFSQSQKDPVEVTPELQKQIKQQVEKEIPKFKQKLQKQGEEAAYYCLHVPFCI